MAAAVKSEFGVDAELIQGHGGIFDVSVDGAIAFTNAGRCGPLPWPEEVVQAIRDARGSGR